jgi:hypothetical protein
MEAAMKYLLISAAALASGLALALPAIAQDLASQIVGVWRVKSFDSVEIESQKANRAYGNAPRGTYIFTKSGHFALLLTAEKRNAPATDSPTEAERADLFRSMAAAAGTYKVAPGKVTFTYTDSWIERWTGTTRLSDAEVKGNVLTFKSLPIASTLTGKTIVFTTVLERVE